MKLWNTLLISTASLLNAGYGQDTPLPFPLPQLQEPVVQLTALDQTKKPIFTACAYPADEYLAGAPYSADTNGVIRMTAVIGEDILVFAPKYEDTRVPAGVWYTNRFPAVTLKLKQ